MNTLVDTWHAEGSVVRPAPDESALCRGRDEATAEWIAQRLNLAAKLEQMTYDFATGKTDGSEIVAMVREAVDA